MKQPVNRISGEGIQSLRDMSHPEGSPLAHFMFRCQLCQCVVPARTPCQYLVVKRRPKEYPYRSRANVFVRTNEAGKRKEQHTDDPGGQGQEIAKEVMICPTCASQKAEE